MQDYEFEVTIVVVVRVWAENESLARGIVASSAPLSSPSADEIRLANEGEFPLGKQATIVAIDFEKPDQDSIKLVGVERQDEPQQRMRSNSNDATPWSSHTPPAHRPTNNKGHTEPRHAGSAGSRLTSSIAASKRGNAHLAKQRPVA